MKNVKKFLAILLCMAVSSSSFIALGSTKHANAPIKKIDYSKHNEYTWWLQATPLKYYTDYSENPIVKLLDKKFNTTFKFQQPAAGTEQNSMNIMMATGSYTDLIDSSYYTGSVNELYQNGSIINIADYLGYMPNLKALLASDREFKKGAYSDDGRILKLPVLYSSPDQAWGGLVYREDILKTMTGGHVKFPSGKSTPTTVQDWDYMLPLYKQYFEAAKMKDYAPLIIPAIGYFQTSDLLNGFGASASTYIDHGKVKFGPLQDGFYNYLVKMNEWYEKGYIYKDFASRTNDVFYLPNTALTYGGAAGIWFGLSTQLGDVMSIPKYNLNMNVQAMTAPIDTAHGVKSAPDYVMYGSKGENFGGPFISSKCKDVERLLSSLDYLYSKEASYFASYGLDAKNAANDELYNKVGLKGGSFSLNSKGEVSFSSAYTKNDDLAANFESFMGNRLPGLRNKEFSLMTSSNKNDIIAGRKIWATYKGVPGRLPLALYRTADQDKKYTRANTKVTNYLNSQVVKFIMGRDKLNASTWRQFKNQLILSGANDLVYIAQQSYNKYLKR